MLYRYLFKYLCHVDVQKCLVNPKFPDYLICLQCCGAGAGGANIILES